MNSKKQTIKYILLDFFSAGLAWILFNFFRKRVIESGVYGTLIDLQISKELVFNTLFISVFWILVYYFTGYYYKVYKKSRLQEFSQTLTVSVLFNILLFFVLILDDVVASYTDYYYSFVTLVGLHFFLTYIPRSILTTYTIKRIRRGEIGFNTIVIGSGSKSLEIIKSYTSQDMWGGYRFVGFVDIKNNIRPELKEVCPHLGNFEDIEKIVSEHKAEEVIIAIECIEHHEIERIISKLQICNVSIKIIPDLFEILIGKIELSLIEGTPLLLISSHLMPVWEQNLKNLSDKLISLFSIILLSPVYLVLAICVKLSSKGPIIYKQKRVGLHGKEFTIYKFRSMHVDAEKNGPELSSASDPRVTRCGLLLRKTRLDEIPQFFNVLIGDMALVGPRPERRYYIDQIVKKAPEYMMLLKTRPGITSLGQVKYGYAENIDQMLKRLKYDIIYIKNMSLYFDFKILIYTVLTLLKQNGK
jgi:exopolysaccharide biosynthesis polyprenyl glycosylphosphotransferase